MALFLIIALSLLTLGLLWWLGRLSRGALSVTGAALSLGLVGYALQGSPNLPGAPVATKPDMPVPAAQNADVKGALLGKVGGEAETLAQADAYFRINRPELAARVLRLAIDKHPESPALWTGLGNAMVAHDRGLLSPAAEFCYKKALRLVPGYPGTLYFYAMALAENDRVEEAKPLFTDLISRMPSNAPMRAQLVADLTKAGLLESATHVPAK
jgi:cytochrome c-type biogenesis protein CcmH/NrfG